MTRTARLLLLLSLSLVLVFGWSKKTPNAAPVPASLYPHALASVSGKVTYKGEPLPAGTLTFHGQGNYLASIGADGTYSTTDLPIGKMVVTVETESANKNKMPRGAYAAKMAKMISPMPESAKSLPQGKYVRIPVKYADPKTSPLQATLKNGENNINFDLTD